MKKLVSIALAALITLTASLTSVAAWGDNGGGRPSYAVEEINEGKLGDKIVFNSISNSVIGNEKNFCSASTDEEAAERIWHGNSISVEDGKEYIIRVYIHNNSPLGMKAIAENVKVALSIPQTSSKEIKVEGYISTDNAEPSKYWDYVTFESSKNFHLEYIYGSASLYNNGIGKDYCSLTDDIVTKTNSGGVLIGYDKLDGKLPGGNKYASYVTVRVKAVYDPEYLAECKVRLVGTKAWSKSVSAKAGDEIEIQTAYKNLSFKNEVQDNVTVGYVLPDNIAYVNGSAKLWNISHPDGLTIDDSVVGNGINIGSYTLGANAYVRICVKVVNDGLECGENILVGKTKITIGRSSKQGCICVSADV